MEEPARERLLSAAAALGAEVAAAARPAAGGSVVWLRAEPGPPAPLPPHLYDGTAGIALFLSAQDRVGGTEAFRGTVAAALRPLAGRLRALAADPGRAAALRLPPGGMVGVGSWAYALGRIAGWTGDAALLDAALDAARLLAPEGRPGGDAVDVVEGWAGAVLALLALHDLHPAPDVDGETPLERALRCAAPLVAGPPPPIGGFAHGASGYACALLRLHARTGHPALREAAHRALEAERALFEPEAANWRDPRTGRLLEQSAWCHGAPGIALARAAVLAHEPALGDELVDVLALVRSLPPRPLDHLCCGTAGIAEVLRRCAEALASDEVRREAGSRALSLVVPAGALRLRPPGEPPVFDPALFRGAAGIGYALLRAAAPATLPCVLLLE